MMLKTIYILGAGFSKTCGIATDLEMLGVLADLLKREPAKDGTIRSSIEHLLEQNFPGETSVGFERFMSTLSAQKFLSDALTRHSRHTQKNTQSLNIFRNCEREIQRALTSYLQDAVGKVQWDSDGGRSIQEFVRRVDWRTAFVLTFNYDRLLETAAESLGMPIQDRVLHLHGAIGVDKRLAWPTFTKFAYRTTKEPLGERWAQAFQGVLRKHTGLEKLVFIGYSMPPTDLEARGLFNYADWYNRHDGAQYQIEIIDPAPKKANFEFLRQKVSYRDMTLSNWLTPR